MRACSASRCWGQAVRGRQQHASPVACAAPPDCLCEHQARGLRTLLHQELCAFFDTSRHRQLLQARKQELTINLIQPDAAILKLLSYAELVNLFN